MASLILIFYLLQGTAPSWLRAGGHNHRLGASAGLVFHETRDRLISPLFYSGWNLEGEVQYRYAGTRNGHDLMFRYSRGAVKSPWGSRYDEDRIGIEYGFSRRLRPGPFGTNIVIGGRWRSRFVQRVPCMIIEAFRDSMQYCDLYSYEFFSSMGPSLEIRVPLFGKGAFRLEFSGSPAAYVRRPGSDFGLSGGQNLPSEVPPLIERIRGGGILVFPEFGEASLAAAFRAPLGKNELEMIYRFWLCTVSGPPKLESVSHYLGFRFFTCLFQ